jgi:hypothetical protein
MKQQIGKSKKPIRKKVITLPEKEVIKTYISVFFIRFFLKIISLLGKHHRSVEAIETEVQRINSLPKINQCKNVIGGVPIISLTSEAEVEKVDTSALIHSNVEEIDTLVLLNEDVEDFNTSSPDVDKSKTSGLLDKEKGNDVGSSTLAPNRAPPPVLTSGFVTTASKVFSL